MSRSRLLQSGRIVFLLTVGAIGSFQSYAVADRQEILLEPVGVFRPANEAIRSAEIVAYDKSGYPLFVSNGNANAIDIVSIKKPSQPRLVKQVPLKGSPTHVAVCGDLVAASVASSTVTDPGLIEFFSTNGNARGSVTVGPLPDMITFTPDGRRLLVANEGEPSSDYKTDPEGSVSIIELADEPSSSSVSHIRFSQVDPSDIDCAVRVYGPQASRAADFEPEYIAVSPIGNEALVTLQENNAFAILDLCANRVRKIVSLGFRDYRNVGMDASDRDGRAKIQSWPVFGMYQPDGTNAFESKEGVIVITANEGDVRNYDGFNETCMVAQLSLDPQQFPDAALLQAEDQLGRLNVTRTIGDTDGDGDMDQLYVPGTRSFSIWNMEGEQVYDSGDLIERWIAQHYPRLFNSQHTADTFDDRSDDCGPEPEGVAVGRLDDRLLAFVGLERFSGIDVVDITEPRSPQIYHGSTSSKQIEPHPRDDCGPEGLNFIAAADSPTGKPLLAVA